MAVVLRRLDDARDRLQRGIELRLRQLVEEEAAQVDIRLGGRMAEPDERVAQDERGGIEVAQGSQPFPLRLARRSPQQLTDNQVERVNDVVDGGGLKRGGEGDEMGQPPLGAHAIERLGPGLGGKPGERFEATLGGRRRGRGRPGPVLAPLRDGGAQP